LIDPIMEPICQSTCPGMPPLHDGGPSPLRLLGASPRRLDALPDRVVIYLAVGGPIAWNLVGETLFTIGYLISRGVGRVARAGATATTTLSNIFARVITVIGRSATTCFAGPYHPATNSCSPQHAT
jgi:hypothetical protein